MLHSILACAEAYGPVTAIRSPKGMLADLLDQLVDHPDLAALATEGVDVRLHVEAGGTWWPFGGLV